MGANAQTTVPTFTASQVLTADQMNQSARTGVPVFATTVTRDAAFGGTGEKTLAEGQMCYVEGTGLQTYNGSSWVTWGTSSPGTVLITPSTAFTTAGTINVNNVFTTAYSGYRVTINVTARSTTLQILMRLRAAGTDTVTQYYSAMVAGDFTSAAMIYGPRANNATSFPISDSNSAVTTNIHLDVMFPAQTQNTLVDGTSVDFSTAYSYRFGGGVGTATSFDGFSILTSTGTITGTYSIVGYKL